MSTMVEEDVRTDNITELIFAYAPECEWKQIKGDEACDEAAAFKCVLSCCAELWLVCEDHLYEILDFLKHTACPQHNPDLGGCGGSPVRLTSIDRM